MKLLLSLLALCFIGRVTAQEKFVEVTVSDTVLVEANTFVYQVSAKEPSEDRYAIPGMKSVEQKLEQAKRRQKQMLDSVIQALQQKGFTILPLSADDSLQSARVFERLFSRRILVHTVDSVVRLYQLIKNDPRLDGSVITHTADESAAQKALWGKIIAEARKKAMAISEATNHHITGVLSVIDKPQERASGWTSYPPLHEDYTFPGWHMGTAPEENVLVTGVPINTFYPIRATFTVRFAME